MLWRWRRDELIVDVLPVDEHVLGSCDRWHPDAIETARPLRSLANGVRVVTPALFIATSESVRWGGRGDIVASLDLEGIVAVPFGRPEIMADVTLPCEREPTGKISP